MFRSKFKFWLKGKMLNGRKLTDSKISTALQNYFCVHLGKGLECFQSIKYIHWTECLRFTDRFSKNTLMVKNIRTNV